MPFITNSQQKKLEDRLREIIPKTKEINILVGFFYFSATPVLYQILKEMDEDGKLTHGHIKILVGLDTDQHLSSLYEYALETKTYTKQSLLEENFLKSLEKAFTSSQTDRQEFYQQVEFFIKLLQEEKIIIKKTKKPNHSKLYLFILDDTITPSLFITGSSNLTKAGLSHQDEFNVEIKDYGFEEAKEYFDRLWKEAVFIDTQKIIDHLSTKTFFRKITPFEAYVYALKTYIDTYTDTSEASKKTIHTILEEAKYKPYSYQVEAIAQAVKIIQTHGGVILADVVGLGKSVIASAVAKKLGTRGIVIAPPHLIGDDDENYGWKKYLADFKLHDWRVFSAGKLEEAADYVSRHDDIKTVIVDEAHRFRNEDTKSYETLKKICTNKKIILLTATPFNNRPSDISALLKLFTIPKKSSIVFDGDLKSKFDEFERLFTKLSYIKTYHHSKNKKNQRTAQRYYKEVFGRSIIDMNEVNKKSRHLADQIKGIIQPVVIRRNRLDLKYYLEKIDLPEVKDPVEKFFELSPQQLKFYDEVIQTFDDITEGGEFTGAIYFPERYKKDSPEEEDFTYLYQKNLYSFMRRLLVKRFESSFGAFRQSIDRFLKIHKNALEFINKTGKFILDRELIEEILSTDDDEVINQKLEQIEEEFKSDKSRSKYKEVYDVNSLKKSEEFIQDIQKDIKLFEDLLKKFDRLGLNSTDPKAQKLIETVKEFIKDRKVIIFTEYKDTAEHLRAILEKEFEGQVLTAYGNLTKTTLNTLYENFDAGSPVWKDDYKILLATDKLSEGFNLNRGGVVINYDIPWNPVRVIQRVGRINRIGKKVYDQLYIVNFFPTEKGADIVRSREIAQNKMFMIHKVLGEDAKIFSPDEEPQASTLYKRLNTFMETEEESFISKIKKELEDIKHSHPEIFKHLNNLPPRIKVAKHHTENNIVVIIKKAEDLFVAYKQPDRNYQIVSFEEVYSHIKSQPQDRPLPLSENFWEEYRQVLEMEQLKPLKKSSKDRETQARNVLKTILQNQQLHPELKQFIEDLIDDIDNLGTLSEYTLSRIIKWENLNTDQLTAELENLQQQYTKPEIGFTITNQEPVYIVAVENKKS